MSGPKKFKELILCLDVVKNKCCTSISALSALSFQKRFHLYATDSHL